MENKKCSILKIYASTTDKINSKLLYEYVVHKARNQGLCGVTVCSEI